jgi:hypothetical protein
MCGGRIDHLGHEGHHLVEVCGGGQVADTGKDANVKVHCAAHCRYQSIRRQEPVILSDPNSTRPVGAKG